MFYFGAFNIEVLVGAYDLEESLDDLKGKCYVGAFQNKSAYTMILECHQIYFWINPIMSNILYYNVIPSLNSQELHE